MIVKSISHYDAKRNGFGHKVTGERAPSGAKSRARDAGDEHLVYVVGEEGGTTFKVGRTGNIRSRMSFYHISHPGELLCLVQLLVGGRDESVILERDFHRLLRAKGFRIKGEWYSFDCQLLPALVHEVTKATAVQIKTVRGAPSSPEYEQPALEREAWQIRTEAKPHQRRGKFR